MKNRNTLIILLMFFVGSIFAQKTTRPEYIAQWKETAKHSMRMHGIPASITLAQACLESADGNSMLATKGNNHFGIKCHSWEGKKIYHDDDKKQECFRKYKKAEQSFEDHALFLTGKTRYAALFELRTDDYKGWARGLKKAGYATNPKYPGLLIKIIEDNELYLFDQEVLTEGKRNKRKDKKKKTEAPEIVVEKVVDTKKNKTESPKPKIEKPKIKKERVVTKDTIAKVETKKQEPEFGEQTIEVAIGKVVEVHQNNVKYVVASENDTPQSIAEELNIGAWQIEKYNDVDKNWKFSDGDLVFIQPKRKKAVTNIHTVKEGETIWQISQMHAIALGKLLEYNGLNTRPELKVGNKLFLRKP